MSTAQITRGTTASKVAAVLAVGLAAILLGAPWWGTTATLRLVGEMMVYIALASLWNLLAGYTGLVSVGQQAYVGLGIYTTVSVSVLLGLHPYVAIPLAGIIAALIAVPVASLVFRLQGAYFAIGTWVVAEVFRLTIAQLGSVGLGGGSGISIPSPVMQMLAPNKFWREASIYWLLLLLGIGALALVYGLLRSRVGLALTAIRDSEVASSSLGVSIGRIKYAVYVAVAGMTGMVGSLIALQKIRVSPDAAFSVNDWTAVVIFIVVIGGIGTIEGPIIGTLVYFLLREYLADLGSVYLMILGALAIAIMLVAPQGLWGFVKKRWGLSLFPTGYHVRLPEGGSGPSGGGVHQAAAAIAPATALAAAADGPTNSNTTTKPDQRGSAIPSGETMADTVHDVIQVGYGPVSKMMAIMLARKGHKVAVFERFAEIYPLPRAVCIDHEIYRVMHANGLGPQLDQFTSPSPLYRWFNADWKELLCVDWTAESISGGQEVNFVHQPTVEKSLDKVVRGTGAITLETGWEAIDLEQTPDLVEVTLRNSTTKETRKVRSRYVVGCDGANSFIRGKIGGGQEDLGFEADWLVIDLVLKDGVTVEGLGIPACGQYCNPLRPTTIVPGGMEGNRVCRRWEFMRLPHETKAEMEKVERVWQLLDGWIKPDQADLVRHTVYTFRSLVATKWRDRRIMVAGDAAHVMPPFMGQGMCAGLRDAWNLTWKLDLLLKGQAEDSLLDTYQPERAPHVSDVIRTSIFLGKIICIPDPAEAAKRDEAFLTGQVPPPAPFPILTDGMLHRGADGKPQGIAGQLSPHALVQANGSEDRFDQVAGLGFMLLLAPGVAASELSAENRAFLAGLGGKVVPLAADASTPGVIADTHGKYTGFLAGAGAKAILVRPDFYIYGAADASTTIDQLVGSLRAQLEQHRYRAA